MNNKGMRYFAATLALTAIVTGYVLVQREPARPELRLTQRPAETVPALSPPLPTARMLLDRTDALALTRDQRASLQALDQQWQTESSGLETAIRQEQEVFSRFMREAQADGKVRFQEILSRSADVRELGKTLRERRQQHAETVLELLTESQRRMLSGLEVSVRHGGA